MSQSVYDSWEETLSDEEDLYLIDDIATQPPFTQAPASLGGESESEEDEEEYKQDILDISDDEDSQTPATQDPGRGRFYAEDEDVESVKDEPKDYHNANVFEGHSASQEDLNNDENDDYYIASQHNDEDATQGDDDDNVDMPLSHDPGFHFEGAEISIKEIEESTLYWEENGQPTYSLTLEDYANGCRERALRLAKFWYGLGYRCIDGYWLPCMYIQDREDNMARNAEESRLRSEEMRQARLADMEMEEDVESVEDEPNDYHEVNAFEEHSVSQDNLYNDENDNYIASQHDDDDATQGDDDDDVDMPPSHDPGFHFEGAEISIEEIEASTLYWEENGQPTYTLTLEDYAQGCRQRALRLAKFWHGLGFRCIDGFWFRCIYSPEELRKVKEAERHRKQRRRELKRMYHGTYRHWMEQGLTEDQTFAKLEEFDAESKAWDAGCKRKRDEEDEAAIGSQMKRLRIEEPVASSSKASSSQRPTRGLGKARRH